MSQPLQEATERYAATARECGVPQDQFENFYRAGLVLQPRQLLASAAARECDSPEGPTEIGYGGARGGGKSWWAIAQVAADDCQRAPGSKWLFLRKVGKAGRESFEDLRRAVLHSLPHTYRRQEGIIIFPNDSRIILGHFQNESDVDAYLGLEYDGILVEEATTLTTGKYRDIRTCNRSSKPNWRPRMYSTSNPGGVGHSWYKQAFIDPARRGNAARTRFIPATVLDNQFLNPEYRRSTLETLTGWKRQAWLEGDWDIAAGQFFTTWRHDLHVIRPFEIPREWRVWCALDYGFTHYTVVHLVAQDGDGTLYLVDEHAQRGWLPKRHAVAIKEMLARHNYCLEDLWKFVAGADVFAKRGLDEGQAQTIAESYLAEGIRLEKANDDRINGAGEMLQRLGDSNMDPPLLPRLYVMTRCGGLIDSMPSLEHDPHRPEDVLKVDCDEDGVGGDDFYDCFVAGTPVMTASGPRAIEIIKPGELVWTRAGLRPVLSAWLRSPNASVRTVRFSDGRELTGTPNHPLWVEGKGWVPIDSLRYGDMIVSWKQQGSGKRKSSFFMGLGSGVTPNLVTRIFATTIGPVVGIGRAACRRFTRRFGRPHTVPFLKNPISTIETKTLSTMFSKILSACSRKNTAPGIFRSGCQDCADTSTLSALWPLRGIHLRKEGNGISSMEGMFSALSPLSQCAVPAVVPIIPARTHKTPSFVPISASQRRAGLLGWTMRREHVNAARGYLQPIGTARPSTVPLYVLDIRDIGERADAYTLEVEGEHEYFANGVLAKNCARYGVMAAWVPRGGWAQNKDSLELLLNTFVPGASSQGL